jgi:molybdopterin-binding protein
MALVEIQVGPHRIVSLMPAEVVDQLKLESGAQAVASVISETAVIFGEGR